MRWCCIWFLYTAVYLIVVPVVSLCAFYISTTLDTFYRPVRYQCAFARWWFSKPSPLVMQLAGCCCGHPFPSNIVVLETTSYIICVFVCVCVTTSPRHHHDRCRAMMFSMFQRDVRSGCRRTYSILKFAVEVISSSDASGKQSFSHIKMARKARYMLLL